LLDKKAPIYGKWIVGKWIEKPLKLLVNASPTPRMALQPDKENRSNIVRNIRYLSFLNIYPPWLRLRFIIPDSSPLGEHVRGTKIGKGVDKTKKFDYYLIRYISNIDICLRINR
jgi:hypothetical protein